MTIRGNQLYFACGGSAGIYDLNSSQITALSDYADGQLGYRGSISWFQRQGHLHLLFGGSIRVNEFTKD
jgi:hypothetical protein